MDYRKAFLIIAMPVMAFADDTAQTEAFRKAVDAAYIQTGIQTKVETAKQVGSRYAKEKVAGTAAEAPIAVLGTAVQFVRERALTVRVGHNKIATIRRDSVSLTVSF